MSFKGQVLRGEKWFLMNRDANGVLLPVVANDKDKMIDVNIYLEEKKRVEEEKKAKVKSKVKK